MKVTLDASSAWFFDALTPVLSSVTGEILPPIMGGEACIRRKSELSPAYKVGWVPVWFSLLNPESTSSLKLSLEFFPVIFQSNPGVKAFRSSQQE